MSDKFDTKIISDLRTETSSADGKVPTQKEVSDAIDRYIQIKKHSTEG